MPELARSTHVAPLSVDVNTWPLASPMVTESFVPSDDPDNPIHLCAPAATLSVHVVPPFADVNMSPLPSTPPNFAPSADIETPCQSLTPADVEVAHVAPDVVEV